MAETTIRQIRFDSWRQFKSDMFAELFDQGKYRRGVYMYRGQRDCGWRLSPSFDRWFGGLQLGGDRVLVASRLVDAFQKACEHLDLPPQCRSDPAAMTILGQHHGLPTRLLDWSESIYVAAFFAYCDVLSSSMACAEVAIWALDTRSELWRGDRGVEILTPPYIDNGRLRNQGGRFTFSRMPFDCLEDFVDHVRPSRPALTMLTLPADEESVREALFDLDTMGITHARLFPGIDGCARTAQMQVLLDELAVRSEEILPGV